MIEHRSALDSRLAFLAPEAVGEDDSPSEVAEDLTVVIPTLGRPLLEQSLAHLLGGRVRPARVVVVDQGTNARVPEWLATLSAAGIIVDHVRAPLRGRAAAVNRGIERVTTRFFAVTDDDCFADAGWVEQMARCLRGYPDAIVTGRVDPEGDEMLVINTSPTFAIQRRPLLKHDSMCGGNMGAALSTVARIGLLDEDSCIRTAEDCEYSYRALRAGVPIVYQPLAAVRHFGWRTAEQRDAQYAGYARSHGGFYGKYLRRGDAFIALRVVLHHVRALRRWIVGVLRRDRDLASNGRAYVLGLLPGIRAGWRAARSTETTDPPGHGRRSWRDTAAALPEHHAGGLMPVSESFLAAPSQAPVIDPAGRARALAQRLLPIGVRRWLSRRAVWPPIGLVRFASLRRTKPISRQWGFDRGVPVDRYYIEAFMARSAADIRGRVLEIDPPLYTRRYGGARVTRADVLHVCEAKPGVTLVGDLSSADHIPSDTFDCIILTQTLQLIYDGAAVVRTLERILKPGGVALVTVPGISKVSREDMDRWGHHWSYTRAAARRLFETRFDSDGVTVTAHGNVLAAVALLHGVASGELRRKELDVTDPDYQVLITIRAQKGSR